MLLLIAAIAGGGLEIRPALAGGCSIAADEHAPEPLPREDSADESAEDEESGAAKHAALGSAVVFDRPAPRGGALPDGAARLAAGARLGTVCIRGPPSRF